MPLPAPRRPLFGVDQAAATASRFGAPDASGMSAFQRALYNQKADATSSAFDNARSRSRERAAASGMDYTSGVAQSNDNAIENERARAVGNISNEVALESAPLEFQAANLGLNAGNQANIFDQQARKRKQGLFGSIAHAGIGAGSMLANPQSRIGRVLGGLSKVI